MNFLKKKSNIFGLIMFIIMVASSVLLRINNNISKLVGLILFFIAIILGFILLKIDKK